MLKQTFIVTAFVVSTLGAFAQAPAPAAAPATAAAAEKPGDAGKEMREKRAEEKKAKREAAKAKREEAKAKRDAEKAKRAQEKAARAKGKSSKAAKGEKMAKTPEGDYLPGHFYKQQTDAPAKEASPSF